MSLGVRSNKDQTKFPVYCVKEGSLKKNTEFIIVMHQVFYYKAFQIHSPNGHIGCTSLKLGERYFKVYHMGARALTLWQSVFLPPWSLTRSWVWSGTSRACLSNHAGCMHCRLQLNPSCHDELENLCNNVIIMTEFQSVLLNGQSNYSRLFYIWLCNFFCFLVKIYKCG